MPLVLVSRGSERSLRRRQEPNNRAMPADIDQSVARVLRVPWWRSEEHTSELQSLMRISYAVFCLKQKNFHSTLILTVMLIHIIYQTYIIQHTIVFNYVPSVHIIHINK